MKINHILVLVLLFSLIATGSVSAQTLTGCQAGTTELNGIVNNIAPWYCSDVNPQLTAIWTQWLPIMSIAIMVCFSVATIVFLLGTVFRNDRLRTFGIGELYEAFATTVIVALFIFISAVMFGLLPAITAGPIDPYSAALSYIATTISTTSATSSNLFNVVALAGFYLSLTFRFDALDGTVQVPDILAWWGFLISYYFFYPAWLVLVFLIEALVSLYTQFYLLLFMLYASIPVFLIPGVLFRAFPPTRSLGGMMIAMSIGFYFIMPTLFAVAYYYTSNNIASQLSLANGVIAKYGQNANFVQSTAGQNAPLAIAVGQLSSTFNSYWLSILFFPALIIAVTYSTITQIAEIIGGLSKSSSRLRALV